MKVELRNLKQEKWTLEAEPSETVGELKKKNAVHQELPESTNQKMIFSGKVLKDSDTLKNVKYTEGRGYIVCMISKSVPKNASPGPPKVMASSSHAALATTDTSSSNTPPATNASTTISSAATANDISGPSALAMGAQFQTVVDNIMAMGYTQPQVQYAMRRAFNNPDRAVEYLVTGQVPENLEELETTEAGAAGGATDAAASNAGNAETEPEEEAVPNASEATTRIQSSIDQNLFDTAMGDEIDEMEDEFSEVDFQSMLGLDDEELRGLRQAVMRDPASLLKFLQPLVQSNPHTAAMLLENIEPFVQFLQRGAGVDLPGLRGVDEDYEGEQQAAPHTIEISEEEDLAIKRLMELGFERHIVATAYLACDKDEMLTANYLLEHGYED